MAVTTDYQGYMLFSFENGKAAKVPLSAYATKTRRRKLANAYSDKARLVQALQLAEDCEVLFTSSDTRMLIVHSGLIPAKVTKDTQGVAVMALKKKHLLVSARIYDRRICRSQAVHGAHSAWCRCSAQGWRRHRAAHPGIAGRPQKEPEI